MEIQFDKLNTVGGKSAKTKEIRSKTPSGFAKAFFLQILKNFLNFGLLFLTIH